VDDHYVPGDGNGYGANISIGAWDLDGYNIAPGEWFSFWGGIGPVTVERGYRYGGAIINGRSVAQGALAGGICSTSTTLFNAAMRFGLEIGDRTAHYYYIDRYPTGLDATVAIVERLGRRHDLPQRHRAPDRDPRLRHAGPGDLPDVERAQRPHAWR
jgi:vancomycin resistance protein YoaR